MWRATIKRRGRPTTPASLNVKHMSKNAAGALGGSGGGTERGGGGRQGGAGTLCKEGLRRLWLHRLAVFNSACARAVSRGLQIITQ